MAGVPHSLVAEFQEGAALEQMFRETQVEAARFLLTYSLKSHSVPSAVFCGSEVSHRPAQIQRRGPLQGMNTAR